MDEEQAMVDVAIHELIASHATARNPEDIWAKLMTGSYHILDFWPQSIPLKYLDLDEDDLFQIGEYGDIRVSLDWGSGPGGSSAYWISSYVLSDHIILVESFDTAEGEGPAVIAVAPIGLKHELHAYVTYMTLDVVVAMRGAPEHDFELTQDAMSMQSLIRAYQQWGFRHVGGDELKRIEEDLTSIDLPEWLEGIASSNVDGVRFWAHTGDKVTEVDEVALLHLARIMAWCEAAAA